MATIHHPDKAFTGRIGSARFVDGVAPDVGKAAAFWFRRQGYKVSDSTLATTDKPKAAARKPAKKKAAAKKPARKKTAAPKPADKPATDVAT